MIRFRRSSWKRLSVTLVTSGLAVACATSPPRPSYRQVLDSWLNADINKLIRAWGTPNETFRMPNGNTRYIYTRASSRTEPLTITPGQPTHYVYDGTTWKPSPQTTPSTVSGGETITRSCRTEIEAEPSGRIVQSWYRGNDCR